MALTVTFDLTMAQVQETMQATGTGLFGGLKRKLMNKAVTHVAHQLAGPTTMEVSEAGLRITRAGSVQELSWEQVGSVNERHHAWAIQHRPNGISFIPAAAVAPEERTAFAQQLQTWAGSKYRVVDRGMVEPAPAVG